ncbi:peptidoglycan DD-metalloendopeptidase family protein [Sedimentibacter sp. zth1]|uniref:peptidoglycan DD-metalloendopeptidase family protein n=1 Tax=Sedimentibacter sp. zth1 TaxID=2816908 RepID=UPI001A91E0C1|nr:peptidoglycan DD-metalloendopeptidase family protein [Sedimentibacter sp. zth1]QSX05423.1 peptidoglycan DD-metalloendopeptidase family protein [Sedimentibacter sp. zth1]
MKNTNKLTNYLITVLTIVILFSNLSVYANTSPQNDIDTSIDAVEANEAEYLNIQMNLTGLNFFNPISFDSIGENLYQTSLYNKFFTNGDVKLLIVENYNGEPRENEDNTVFNSTINSTDSIILQLEDDKDYLYNIFITKDNKVVSTHYGQMQVKDGIVKCSSEFISDDKTIQTQQKVQEKEHELSIQSTATVVKTYSYYEKESNNTRSAANTIKSGMDVYGRMASTSDYDFYKITLDRAGYVNFWLGDIYKNCDYDLFVYDSLYGDDYIYSSTNNDQSQELIKNKYLSAGTYYIKVVVKKNTSKVNWEYYYFLRARITSDNSTGIAWPTIETKINACYQCDNYKIEYDVLHGGVDIAGSNANPIVAMSSGTVSHAGTFTTYPSSTYGKVVFINHDTENPYKTGSSNAKFQSRYAHMCEILVTNGQQVQRGKILGYIGNTGASDGEHLHFEIRTGSSFSSLAKINPLTFYPGSWTCSWCGKSCGGPNGGSTQSTNSVKYFSEEPINDLLVQTTIKQNGFYNNIEIRINDEYILDYETIISMSPDELENYGITKEIIKKLISRINENSEQTKYCEIIDNLNNIFNQ